MHSNSRTQDSPCQRPWGAFWSRLAGQPLLAMSPHVGWPVPAPPGVCPLSAPLLSPDRSECSLEAGDAREGRVGPWGSSGQGGGWGAALGGAQDGRCELGWGPAGAGVLWGRGCCGERPELAAAAPSPGCLLRKSLSCTGPGHTESSQAGLGRSGVGQQSCGRRAAGGPLTGH